MHKILITKETEGYIYESRLFEILVSIGCPGNRLQNGDLSVGTLLGNVLGINTIKSVGYNEVYLQIIW